MAKAKVRRGTSSRRGRPRKWELNSLHFLRLGPTKMSSSRVDQHGGKPLPPVDLRLDPSPCSLQGKTLTIGLLHTPGRVRVLGKAPRPEHNTERPYSAVEKPVAAGPRPQGPVPRRSLQWRSQLRPTVGDKPRAHSNPVGACPAHPRGVCYRPNRSRQVSLRSSQVVPSGTRRATK